KRAACSRARTRTWQGSWRRLWIEIKRGSQQKGLFGPAEELTVWKNAQLVLLLAERVQGKAPGVAAKVAQPAQRDRRVAQPLQVYLARLGPVLGRPVCGRFGRLLKGVDVTELRLEANIEAGIKAGRQVL